MLKEACPISVAKNTMDHQSRLLHPSTILLALGNSWCIYLAKEATAVVAFTPVWPQHSALRGISALPVNIQYTFVFAYKFKK